jgi:hypothetical protein
MHEVAQKFMSTPLFNFQDLKLSTRDIITILEDTLNTTSGPLPILDPHATKVPSNTSNTCIVRIWSKSCMASEKSSKVVRGLHDMVFAF